MSITANQTDLINWGYYLKGNSRKGVHRLREIIGTPSQAADFCANAGAVSLVLGHDPSYPDGNSEELRALLLGSDYADSSVETWLPEVFDGATAEAVLADKQKVAALVAGSASSAAVLGSDKWAARAVATLAGQSAMGIEDVRDVTESESMMEAVASSDAAAAATLLSPRLTAAIAASPGALAAVADVATGGSQSALLIATGSRGLMDAFLTDSTARGKLRSVSGFASAVAGAYASSVDSVGWQLLSAVANVAAASPSTFESAGYLKKTVAVNVTGFGDVTYLIGGIATDGAGFALIPAESCLGTHRMNASNTTAGGWESSEGRSWLNSEMLAKFPADLQPEITPVRKVNTSGYGNSTVDKLFYLSLTEVGEGGREGTAYPIFTDDASRIRKNGSSATAWWLRSVSSSSYFRYISSSGSLNYYSASYAYGVVPCFCIG